MQEMHDFYVGRQRQIWSLSINVEQTNLDDYLYPSEGQFCEVKFTGKNPDKIMCRNNRFCWVVGKLASLKAYVLLRLSDRLTQQLETLSIKHHIFNIFW